jgi:hypothetical protein
VPLNKVESSDQIIGSERSNAGVITNNIETKARGSALFLHSKKWSPAARDPEGWKTGVCRR